MFPKCLCFLFFVFLMNTWQLKKRKKITSLKAWGKKKLFKKFTTRKWPWPGSFSENKKIKWSAWVYLINVSKQSSTSQTEWASKFRSLSNLSQTCKLTVNYWFRRKVLKFFLLKLYKFWHSSVGKVWKSAKYQKIINCFWWMIRR